MRNTGHRSRNEKAAQLPKLLSAIAIAGVLAVSLAACSSAGSNGNGASASCAATKSGSNSDKVKVTGKLGSEPTVAAINKLSTTTTERTVVTEGTGKVAIDGTSATIKLVAYNGTSGKKIDSEGYGSSAAVPITVGTGNEIAGLYKAVHCATPGSRVVTVVPPADAFGTAGQESLGVGAKDSIVFVIDVVGVKGVLARADGTPQPAQAGFPTVKLSSKGAPTITIPKADPPNETTIAVLKKGSGATVKSGATVTVHYTGVVWASGTVFDSSWTRGAPASFSTTGVINGFGKALVGQKVGSQVMAVIPPADGYGASPPAGSGIAATDTLVFVVDILATN